MQIIEKRLDELTPYAKNPRKNDAAVKPVMESIKKFGFKVPIVVDKDGVIVTGHTRYKAAKKLSMETVPCVVADDLTPKEIKAFRLADNKVAEVAEWDFGLLSSELDDLFDFDMEAFGFEEAEEKEERSERKEVSLEEKYQIIVDCVDEFDAGEKYEKIMECGIECRVSTL